MVADPRILGYSVYGERSCMNVLFLWLVFAGMNASYRQLKFTGLSQITASYKASKKRMQKRKLHLNKY